MKKQTKNILTKLALVAAPFAVAATITTSAVSANADQTGGDWVMTPAEKANMEKATDGVNEMRKESHTTAAESEAQGEAFQKQQDAEFKAHIANMKREFGGDTSQATTKPAKNQAVKKHAKKVAKKRVAKKHASKKATKKHVAKKRVVKKHARKHECRLFRIRVKAHKIYAYKTSNFRHHKGRRVERKGTKLYVYGTVRRGHTTYYKVYGGRFITSSHHYVTRVAR